jgi:hypothetical protein
MQPTSLQLFQLALISGGFALGGLVLGALIAGVYNLRAKRNEYVNEYYKIVIQRRIAAYEQLENLIIAFKASVVDRDNKPYHVPFSGENDKVAALIQLGSAMSQGLWLSDEAFKKTTELNYILFRLPTVERDVINFGKEHYQAIAELREALERILAADMLDMHKVGRFLRRKKTRKLGFHAVQLYPPDTQKPS